ncbi:MAG: hypothetical protein J7L83_03735 [Thaumarchaeota archaeon]|nr:hypothetical protein [Nitrososphaerota archaeon]
MYGPAFRESIGLRAGNELRKKEVEDAEIAREIEKVRGIWLRHAPKDYFHL